jgi:UDP-N-acetylglucosamine---dolichyl-phosphate N-acetylglucosaminyltransferase
MRTFIAIPAFNEGKIIKSVLESINNEGYKDIVVANDGSSDNTHEQASALATVVTHVINRGKGAATKTAMEAAVLLGADIVVTIDADGQHNPKDIQKLITPIEAGKADVVLGSRMLNPKGMPVDRMILNTLGSIITFILFGLYVSDSQSGMRAYSKKAISRIDTKLDKYEFESEVISEIKNKKLAFKEVPISVIYSNYSLRKWKNFKGIKSQGIVNGINMAIKLTIKSLFS